MRRRSNGSPVAPDCSFSERRSAGPITASGSTISAGTARNTQRQPTCWVTAPDTTGPTIEGSTQAEENAANTAGRSRSG